MKRLKKWLSQFSTITEDKLKAEVDQAVLIKIENVQKQIRMTTNKPIKLIIETEEGSRVMYGFKDYPQMPTRNDVVGYKGENYKVIYRKFIYLVGNSEIDTVVLKVQLIDKKF